MKSSPVNLKDVQAEACYDPKEEFNKFLEEARKHAGLVNLHTNLSTNAGNTHCIKRNKSWKRTLSFLWRCSDMKRSAQQRTSTNTNGHTLSRGPVSGPVACGEGREGIPRRLPASGPLAICFTPTMAEETETVYVTLGQVQHYGPIYRVT
ncbi:hypothetical protein HPP92_016651 [Vanilla planifolia]|uniref:Uncharacterized protein n=1 Tax=Vanilla planifolia TaxID=51239 RepID=A0A835QFL7_VANPL|nr:hypothetical protein HPP92_016651 [Vanilla planifolia]